MKKRVMTSFLACLSFIAFTGFAHAQTQEDNSETFALVDRVVAAYGATSLAEIETYRVTTESMSPTFGQGHSPRLDEMTRNKSVLLVDIKNNRAAIDNWNENRGGIGQGVTFVDGESAFNLNLVSMLYEPAASADLYQLAGGIMRTTDTLLAKELAKAKEMVVMSGSTRYMNRDHTLLTMPFPFSPEIVLYIDNETALISKMQRNHPTFGELDYVFSHPKYSKGFTYASQANFFIGGKINILTVSHQVEVNVDVSDSDFALPQEAIAAGDRFDASEMIVNKISDRVYHIGQNGGFSIFIDTPSGIVGAGGYPGIAERLQAYRTASESHKLLTHQVVTHHHSDHVAGLGEAANMGAKLVTVVENIDAINEFVNPEFETWDWLTIAGRATFSDGRDRVEIHEVSTSHAASFLVTYIPSARTVFIADHFGSPFASGVPLANLNTVTMHAALEALDLDIKTIATAHNGRLFSWKEMQQSVARYKTIQCELERPVCDF